MRADIRKLPFKDNSIDGIWNLGVMEHFSKKEIHAILNEFKRVLKKDGTMLIFWPPRYSLAHIFFSSIETAARILGKKIQIFPDEPSLLHSKKEAKEMMKKAGLNAECFFNYRDGFCHIIVMARKT